MATRTTQAAGNLISDIATVWGGSAPAAGDTLLIAHACTLTAEQQLTCYTLKRGSENGTLALSGRCKINNTGAAIGSNYGRMSTPFATLAAGSRVFANAVSGGSDGQNGTSATSGGPGTDGASCAPMFIGPTSGVASLIVTVATDGGGGAGGDGYDLNEENGYNGGAGGSGGTICATQGSGEVYLYYDTYNESGDGPDGAPGQYNVGQGGSGGGTGGLGGTYQNVNPATNAAIGEGPYPHVFASWDVDDIDVASYAVNAYGATLPSPMTVASDGNLSGSLNHASITGMMSLADDVRLRDPVITTTAVVTIGESAEIAKTEGGVIEAPSGASVTFEAGGFIEFGTTLLAKAGSTIAVNVTDTSAFNFDGASLGRLAIEPGASVSNGSSTGDLDCQLIVANAGSLDWPAEADVLKDVSYANGSKTGTLDVEAAEAAAAAAQLADDIAAVDAEKANIVTGTTILTKAGEYPTTATSQAAQLATDVAAVEAQADKILEGNTILGVEGTLTGGGMTQQEHDALMQLASDYTTTRAVKLDYLDVAVSTRATPADAMTLTAAYDAAKSAAQPGDAMTLTSAERNSVADALLSRSVSTVEATAGDHSLCYMVLAASEASTAAHEGKLTVFRTDGVTEFVQKNLTQQAGADPITGIG